jgi:hypothetical protein
MFGQLARIAAPVVQALSQALHKHETLTVLYWKYDTSISRAMPRSACVRAAR